MVDCIGNGLGLGGGIAAESLWISGACNTCDLRGNNRGFMGFGGAGVTGVGGSYSGGSPPYSSGPGSPSSGIAGGVGLGLGGGYIGGECRTTVLSCSN